MPFRSKAQMRAAFSGALGAEMKARASTWAHETPNAKGLPEHARKPSAVASLRKASHRRR